MRRNAPSRRVANRAHTARRSGGGAWFGPAQTLMLAVMLALLAATTAGCATGKAPAQTGSGGDSGEGTGGATGDSGSGGATGAGTGGSATGSGSDGTSGGGDGTGGIPVVGGSGGAGGASGVNLLAGKKVLLIVDDPSSLDDGEIMFRDSLAIGKAMVVTVGDTTGPASLADGQDLIVGASGVSASEFAALYGPLPVPILTFGQDYMAPLGYIPSGSSNKGNAASSSTLTIGNASTPLAAAYPAGMQIPVILSTRNTQIYWGLPGGAPIKVAGVSTTPTELVVFGFEPGAMMATGTAAGRRVNLGWKMDALKDLKIESYRLMNAALVWLATGT